MAFVRARREPSFQRFLRLRGRCVGADCTERDSQERTGAEERQRLGLTDSLIRVSIGIEAMKKLWWSEAAKHGALPLLEAPGGRRRTYNQFFDY